MAKLPQIDPATFPPPVALAIKSAQALVAADRAILMDKDSCEADWDKAMSTLRDALKVFKE